MDSPTASSTSATHARRAYWIAQMDAAHDFMNAILGHPVKECGEGLVYLPDAARAAGVEVAFSALRTARGFKRLYYLREGLVPNFLAAAGEMNRRGWVLKVEDGYRTRAIQTGLSRRPRLFKVILRRVRWELGGGMPAPEHLLRRVSVLIATRPKTGTHMSGSAVDISVLSRRTGVEVDRGASYLEMSILTPMASPFVSRAAAQNRRRITDLMARHGFRAFPWEFWHYSKDDAMAERVQGSRRPGRYGAVDFDPKSGSLRPIRDPLAFLTRPRDIKRMAQRACSAR